MPCVGPDGHRCANGSGGHRDAAGTKAGDCRRRAANVAACDSRDAACCRAQRRAEHGRASGTHCVPLGHPIRWSRLAGRARRWSAGDAAMADSTGSFPPTCLIGAFSGGRILGCRTTRRSRSACLGRTDRRGAAVLAGGSRGRRAMVVSSIAEHDARRTAHYYALSRWRPAGNVLAPFHVGNSRHYPIARCTAGGNDGNCERSRAASLQG